MRKRQSIVIFLFWTVGTSGLAGPALSNDEFETILRPFFGKYCLQCHSAELSEGNLRLDNIVADFVNRPTADQWIEIVDRLNLAEMPPQDELQPSNTELGRAVDWMAGQIQAAQRSREATGGQVILRRMTRREYANTVRDLLHVDFIDGEGPADQLPPDGSIRGFDRHSHALMVDPSLMQAYFDVAVEIANQAIRFRRPMIPTRTIRFEYRDIVDSAMKYQIDEPSAYLDGDTLVVMQGGARSFAKLRHPYNDQEVPVTGRYRVRIQAAADAGASGAAVYMRVKQGADENIAQFRVDAPPESPQVYEFETIRDAMLQGEYSVSIVDGTEFQSYVSSRGQRSRAAAELLQKGEVELATRDKARLNAQGEDVASRIRPEVLHTDALPKLRLDWIEVTGPLQGDYPPQSMKAFFVEGWEPEKWNKPYAQRLFARFLPRAYRRPVTKTEIDEVVRLVKSELDNGSSFEAAIQTGIIATLCSPKFLYFYEPSSTPDTPRALNNYELASRLSYFLWSTQPDDDLYRLAAKKQLEHPAVLEREVDRMLADPRTEGFLQGFARQWLKIDEFNRFPPDQAIYPEYYATHLVGLNSDLRQQPLEMLAELIRTDGSLTDFVDSEWTMLNERLAAFYEIDGVRGEAFRRVELVGEAQIRGGLLGMSGVHRWGSDGNRTKPVERGKYILDVLFNDPPPPPPPNAGEVEPNIQGQKLTVAERLALHREQRTCNNCHRRIDPYGLALENFNAIGNWRTQVDGERPLAHWGKDRPAIVVVGTLPSGDKYEDFVTFKQALGKQHERFIRGLTEKLWMYALARSVEPSDRDSINRAVASCQTHGFTIRSLIKSIVTSESFRQK
ncbi:MAG: DUF1592 domain-containing protein [Pirellulaceae bacterium]